MIEWKKVFYYAIVPALIAGLFAIAPKLYEIATEPNAELKYSLIKGPEIQVENGFQSIFSVVVQNTGKKALTNVSATLNVKNGKFESYKVQDKNGIKLQVNANESKIEVLVDKLFASESFSTSILMLSSVPDFKPEFSLRSGEVLGQEKATNLKKENSFTGILGAMLSALSVFITAIYITFKSKKLRISNAFHGHKQDAIFYILARLGLLDIFNELNISSNEFTYLRIADILLFKGLQFSGAKRNVYITALKLMLLIKMIADTSESVIKKIYLCFQAQKLIQLNY